MVMYSFSGKHSYSFPTNIRFGAGVIEELSDHLRQQDLSNPLVVTDPVIPDLDFFNAIISSCN